MWLIANSNHRFTRVEGDKVEIFIIYIIMTGEIIRIDTDQIAEIGELNLVDKAEVDQGMNKIMGEEILEVKWTYQNFGRQNRREYRGNYRNENYSRGRGRSRSRERSFSRNINNRRMIEAWAIVNQGLDQKWVQIEIE